MRSRVVLSGRLNRRTETASVLVVKEMTVWVGLMGLTRGWLTSSPALTRPSWMFLTCWRVKGIAVIAVKMAMVGRRTVKTDLMGIPQSWWYSSLVFWARLKA